MASNIAVLFVTKSHIAVAADIVAVAVVAAARKAKNLAHHRAN